MYLKRFIYLILASCLLSACKNEIESDTLSYNCYGNLSSPQVVLTGTNDFYFEKENKYGSTYYFTIDFESDCILDEYSELIVTANLYTSSTLVRTIPISYSNEILTKNGNTLNAGLGILFGDADRAELTFKMVNLLGNEVSLEIEKHEGAN